MTNRLFPLFPIARSHDGQIWEPLSDTDSRCLFDELGRRWELVEYGYAPLQDFAIAPGAVPGDLVAEVVARLERGEVVEVRLNPCRSLHLKVMTRQYVPPGIGEGHPALRPWFHR